VESQKSLKEDWLLWSLLGGAFVLVLGYYLIVPSPSVQEKKPDWLFRNTQASSISSIRKYRGNKLLFEVKRRADGSGWELIEPGQIDVDSTSVDRWLETILSPGIRRRFKAAPNADYGMGDTPLRLTLVQNGDRQHLYFGGAPPTGQGNYLRYGDAPRAPVFLLGPNVKSSLNKSLYDIRDKGIFKRRADSLERFELSTDEGSVTYVSSVSGWKITQPETVTLNDTQVSTVRDSIRSMLMSTAQTFFDTSPPEEYKPLQARLRFKFKDGTAELKLGGIRDGNRIVRKNEGTVVALSQDPVNLMDGLPQLPEGWPKGSTSSNQSKSTGSKLNIKPGQKLPGIK
jgi:hypothetical protein